MKIQGDLITVSKKKKKAQGQDVQRLENALKMINEDITTGQGEQYLTQIN